MADDERDRGLTASVDGLWVTVLELASLLEPEHPGISIDLHERVATRANLAGVVRLYGQRLAPRIGAGYEEAQRRLGVIATLAPQQVAKRKRRRE